MASRPPICAIIRNCSPLIFESDACRCRQSTDFMCCCRCAKSRKVGTQVPQSNARRERQYTERAEGITGNWTQSRLQNVREHVPMAGPPTPRSRWSCVVSSLHLRGTPRPPIQKQGSASPGLRGRTGRSQLPRRDGAAAKHRIEMVGLGQWPKSSTLVVNMSTFEKRPSVKLARCHRSQARHV